MAFKWSDWRKVVAVYAVLGSPIGWLGLCAIGLGAGVFTSSWSEFGTMLLGALLGLPFSYIMGFIPSVLAGMVVGCARRRLSTWRGWLAGGGIGALCTIVFSVYLGFDNGPQWEWVFNPFIVLGALSGIVCAWVARPRTP